MGIHLIKDISTNMNMKNETKNCFNENLVSRRSNKNLKIFGNKSKSLRINEKKLKSRKSRRMTHDINFQQNERSKSYSSNFFIFNSINKIDGKININRIDKTNKNKDKSFKFLRKLNVIVEFNDTCENIEEDQTQYNNTSRFIINHQDWFRIIWDFIFGMIFYIIFITPAHLSFYQKNNIFRKIAGSIEIFFIFDLIFNFFTTYRNEEETLIANYFECAENYIFTWFLYDLISSCPIELITWLYTDNSSQFSNDFNYKVSLHDFKWINVLRIAKVFSILKPQDE